MQINEPFLVFTPTAKARAAASAPLTREAWSREMGDWLRLHDAAQAPFTPVPPPIEAPLPDPAAMIAARDGAMLGPGCIVKADQFPGIHRADLNEGAHPQPRITGAPNFRKADDDNIYGVAQPTIEGIKGVLDKVGKGPGSSGPPAVWTNLREEPVVYVNGKPHNLRGANAWDHNTENPGASTDAVERSDAQLKADVLAEAQKNGGRLLVTEEGPDGQVVQRWEEVTPESVQTPREVFDSLKAQGYNVDYARVPVSDEKTPEPGDFDALVSRLKDVSPDQPLIFNCHGGRGRTTTAMVVADLVRRGQQGGEGSKRITKEPAVREDIKEIANHDPREYRVVLSLLRAIERAPKSQKEADDIIDDYSALQNLRDCVLDCKERAQTDPNAKVRDEARKRGEQYLERYYHLTMFDAYVKDEAPKGYGKTFDTWMSEHPEQLRMLEALKVAMGFTENPDAATAPA